MRLSSPVVVLKSLAAVRRVYGSYKQKYLVGVL